jgi:hypothetical protein
MKTLLKHSGWLSLLFALPALVLCVAGILFLAFGLDSANEALGAFLGRPVGRLLLSPAVVLGGVLLVIALNLPRVLRLSAGVEDGALYVATWLKLSPDRLVPLAVAGTLLLLLLTYAFVENFRVVAR